jgi:excisionase family DNA binding protein
MSENECANLVMSVDQAARALQISRNTAFSRIHDGSLPAVRLGRRLLVPRKSVDAMLDVKPVSTSRR